MTIYTLPSKGGRHETLGGTADQLNLPAGIRNPVEVEIVNRGAADMWVRGDSQTAVPDALGTTYIPVGGWAAVSCSPGESVSVIGTSGDMYSAEIVR